MTSLIYFFLLMVKSDDFFLFLYFLTILLSIISHYRLVFVQTALLNQSFIIRFICYHVVPLMPDLLYAPILSCIGRDKGMANIHNAATILSGRFYALLFLLYKLAIYFPTRSSFINECIIFIIMRITLLINLIKSLYLLFYHHYYWAIVACSLILLESGYHIYNRRHRSFSSGETEEISLSAFCIILLYYCIIVKD